MPTFSYKALQPNGAIAEGVLDAPGRPDALRQIETLGLRPVNLFERTAAASKNNAVLPGNFSFKFESKKVSAKALENFTRLLSSLLAAGVPLSRALVILCKEAKAPVVAAKWKAVLDMVVDGMSLADAMAKSPETFPRVYTAMVEAGEAGGFLDVVLAQIAEFQSRQKELKSKVLSAMIYPCILFCMATVIMSALLVFFVPMLQKVFATLHGSLPFITLFVIGASNFMRSYGIFIIIGLVMAGFLLRTWFASEKGRRVWEGFILRVPIIGPLVAQFAMARFCRMLGTLLGAGVPLVQSLNVARRSIGNQILVDAVGRSIEQVQQGGRLGQSLGDCKILFSGSALEMISVAEESGKLDVELVRLAGVTEGDLNRNLQTAVSFAEPVLLFFIAAFIGTIVIGMLLPVLSMSSYIKQ
ncbi:MAG TPA: type II secretion system F family protein [Candidatus Acidoferrales bacterium]|jgi:type II secretory pathway component PulF|nr:type II secretion system F family protein [Candidatus Acidoferrales bacterium]